MTSAILITARPTQLQQVIGQTLEWLAVIGLLLTFAFASLGGGATYWWVLYTLRVMAICTVGAWILSCLVLGRWQLPRVTVLIPLIAYGLWAVISTLQSQAADIAFDGLGNILMYIGMLLVTVATINTPIRQQMFYAVWAVVMLFHGVYGLLQSQGVILTPQTIADVSSTYFNPNHYAGFLDLALPSAVAMMLMTKHFGTRIVFSTLSMLLIFNQILNSSYGGKIAVFITLILLVFYLGYLHIAPKWRFSAVVATLFTLGGITFVIGNSLQNPQVQNAIQPIQKQLEPLQKSLMESVILPRLELYARNTDVLLERPWFGSGPSTFPMLFTAHRSPQAEGAGAVTHGFVNYAHNDLLQIGIETGIPSMLFFICVVFCAMWKTPHLPIVFGLIALLGHGIGDGNFSYIPGNTLMGWMFVGILATPQKIQRSADPDQTHNFTYTQDQDKADI